MQECLCAVRATGYIFLASLLAWCHDTYGQYDTSYYISYNRKLTTRFFLSRKFTSLKIKDPDYNITYKPNTTLNLGVGVTRKSITLNLAYGFGFLNPDRGQGKTHYLDLQFHQYGRKVVLDVFGQFYKGFYLSPQGGLTVPDRYYRRPDLQVTELGISAQYVLNNRKFSYRASFLQNERQKKSSGTFLVGFEIYGGWVNADSTIIPAALSRETTLSNPRKFNFFEFGPNIGYAYTFVFHRHFFLTASGSASIDYGINTSLANQGSSQAVGLSPNTFLRLFGGYNSATWGVSAVYISDGVRLVSNNGRQIVLNTGNVRLNLIYHIQPGRKARKALKVVDKAERIIDNEK